MTLKLKEDDSLENHFREFDDVIRELKSVGVKLEEADIVCHLLLSLPESYDAIVTALETIEAEKLTLDFIKGKLLDQEMKRKNNKIVHPCSPAFFNNSKRNENLKKPGSSGKFQQLKCHHCGRKGHTRTECWFRKQAHEAKHYSPDEEEHVAFPAVSESVQDDPSRSKVIHWFIDNRSFGKQSGIF